MAIFDFIQENAELVSALTSVLSVGVWIFYANLLYRQFRHQHHPRVMIHQAPDLSGESQCMLINMSPRLVNVVSIVAVGWTEKGLLRANVSNYHIKQKEDGLKNFRSEDVRQLFKQGPLSSGEYLVIGSFQDLLNLLIQSRENTDEDINIESIHQLEIRVALFQGMENHPLGATRRFEVSPLGVPTKTESGENHLLVRPVTMHTRQLVSIWQRRKVKNWLSQE